MTATNHGKDRLLGAPARRWLAGTLLGCTATFACGCQAMRPAGRDANAAGSAPMTAGDLGNLSKATTDFRKTLTPDQAYNVHLELGKVYESQSNFEAALAEYQKAVELGEKRGNALTGAKLGPAPRAVAERRMAGALDRLGRFTQSEAHYRKALELAPKDAKVWNDVGYSYYLQNRLTDAERALKTAESFDPNDNRISTNLGLTLAAAGRTDEALTYLSRAGGPAIAQANLGFMLAAQGKNEEARSHYQMALNLQPELTAARTALTQLDLQATRANASAIASTATTGKPAASQIAAVGMPPLPSVTPAVAVATPGPASPGMSGRPGPSRDPRVAPVRADGPERPAGSTPAAPLPWSDRPGSSGSGQLPINRPAPALNGGKPAAAGSAAVGPALSKPGPSPSQPEPLADLKFEDLPLLPPEIQAPSNGLLASREAQSRRDPELQLAGYTVETIASPQAATVTPTTNSRATGDPATWEKPSTTPPARTQVTRTASRAPRNPAPPTPW